MGDPHQTVDKTPELSRPLQTGTEYFISLGGGNVGEFTPGGGELYMVPWYDVCAPPSAPHRLKEPGNMIDSLNSTYLIERKSTARFATSLFRIL